MREAAIVATARTAIGKAHRGALNNVHGATLAGHVIAAAVARSGVDPGQIEDVFLGSARCEGAVGSNIARQAALRAGLPTSVCGVTLDRKCASGLQAIAFAAQRIRAGEGGVYVAGGVETVSLVDPHRNTFRNKDEWLLANMPDIYMAMNLTGDIVARRYGISRESQDEFAAISQQRTATAQQEGWFEEEIVPITVEKNVVDKSLTVLSQEEVTLSVDECNRPGTDATGLAKIADPFCPCAHPNGQETNLSGRRRFLRCARSPDSSQGAALFQSKKWTSHGRGSPRFFRIERSPLSVKTNSQAWKEPPTARLRRVGGN